MPFIDAVISRGITKEKRFFQKNLWKKLFFLSVIGEG